MVSLISAINNNKFSTLRPANVTINTIVITYSVTDGTQEAVTIMHKNGASVHYTIGANGFQNQYHLENNVAFYAGKSSWHGVSSVNQYGIGIMLINDAVSPFTEPQINQTIALINDINARHNTTMEVVGLGEVALDKHVAPGKFFPWVKFAEAGIGRAINVPEDISRVCTLNPKDTSEQVTDVQKNLKAHGYAVPETGVFDEITVKGVSVFRERYTPDEANLQCWNPVAEYVLNQLLGVTEEVAVAADGSPSA